LENNYRQGFTLIELLIVVAIIAILAAIAVPNFLEAQTRAKISRARADMRSLCIAVESYRVDGNKYHLYVDPADTIPGGWSTPWLERLTPLTTPVGYMSTIPNDPFTHKTAGGASFSETRNPQYMVYIYCRGDQRYPDTVSSPNKYELISAGPDNNVASESYYSLDEILFIERTVNEASGFYYCSRYDPTNGTVSLGDMYVWGPGNIQK